MPEKKNTLLSYTTTVGVSQTVQEIQRLLASKGALSVNVEYTSGEPSGLTFVIPVFGRPVPFRIPANPEAAYEAMYQLPGVPTRCKNHEQAKRVAWRIMLRWVEAQLAIVQLRQASLDRAFFQYAFNPETNQTFYEAWHDKQQALASAPEHAQLGQSLSGDEKREGMR